MAEIWSNMLFGIALTILTYLCGVWINHRLKWAIANPLLIAIILSSLFLQLLNISYADYMEGGAFINMLVTPATAAIGLSIYRQIAVLKREAVPIIIGSLAGCICSIGTVYLTGTMLGLEPQLVTSMLPKSITTAIAMDVSAQMYGIREVTMLAVVMTGVLGSIIGSIVVRSLHFKDPVATGVAFGTTSHAVGTSKAMEIGDVEGSVSGVCIGVSGLLTAIILAIF